MILINKKQCAQKGIVLLALVVFMALAVMAYVVSELSVVEVKQQRLESTAKTLQRAKQALIAYAVTYADMDGTDADLLPDFPGEYGFLPCPDYNAGGAEGNEDKINCGISGFPKLGFFPWRTLDLPVLSDSSGSCLLYAVTGEYKNDISPSSNKTEMLNEDTNGMFQIVDATATVVKGADPEDRVVAIIFAPGKPFPTHPRNFVPGSLCGDDYLNYDNFLESAVIFGGSIIDNSNVSLSNELLDQFIHATWISSDGDSANPNNDKFLTITRDEIWSVVVNRTDFIQKISDLTEALAMCLSNYAAANTLDRLPWPAAMTMADYRVNENYNDTPATGHAGRFPFFVDNSNDDIPGANISIEIFEEAACSALSVTSGAVVDLLTPDAEYRVLWNNWKDHFFYVVSQGYAPNSGVAACGNCITVDTVQRAAAIIFSGSRQLGETRNEPIGVDADTKYNVDNYLDFISSDNFPDLAGNKPYSTAGTNDVFVCLSTDSPPVVIAC